MILKYDRNGEADRSGEVVEIGGEGRYVSVCRPHWTLEIQVFAEDGRL